MEPIIVALICAAVLGVVVTILAFIRQMLLSRDKNLNDEAQKASITQEAGELEKMRDQMQSSKRFDTHHKVIGANKDTIIYIGKEIDGIFQKKQQLIERHAQLSLKESAVAAGTYDKLKKELDDELEFYDKELELLQQKRAALWNNHTDFQKHLINQEKARNKSLDAVYKSHSGVLERIYVRHSVDSERVALHSIDSAAESFKSMLYAPLQFLMNYFNPVSGVVPGIAAGVAAGIMPGIASSVIINQGLAQAPSQAAARRDVPNTKHDISDSEVDDEEEQDDANSDDESNHDLDLDPSIRNSL
ncbi:MAG: hypothetical protein ACHP65_01035 [Legionellales bacterium]